MKWLRARFFVVLVFIVFSLLVLSGIAFLSRGIYRNHVAPGIVYQKTGRNVVAAFNSEAPAIERYWQALGATDIQHDPGACSLSLAHYVSTRIYCGEDMTASISHSPDQGVLFPHSDALNTYLLGHGYQTYASISEVLGVLFGDRNASLSADYTKKVQGIDCDMDVYVDYRAGGVIGDPGAFISYRCISLVNLFGDPAPNIQG